MFLCPTISTSQHITLFQKISTIFGHVAFQLLLYSDLAIVAPGTASARALAQLVYLSSIISDTFARVFRSAVKLTGGEWNLSC